MKLFNVITKLSPNILNPRLLEIANFHKLATKRVSKGRFRGGDARARVPTPSPFYQIIVKYFIRKTLIKRLLERKYLFLPPPPPSPPSELRFRVFSFPRFLNPSLVALSRKYSRGQLDAAHDTFLSNFLPSHLMIFCSICSINPCLNFHFARYTHCSQRFCCWAVFVNVSHMHQFCA